MDVKTVNELGKELDSFLRLKTKSLGIKLFEKASDIPDTFQVFDTEQCVCAVFGWARFLEIPVALKKDLSISCAASDISFGWRKLPENFAENGAGFFAKTPEWTAKVVEGMLSLNDKYEAFGVCPLDSIPVVPDVIQIWGSPLQLMMCEYASTWNGWDRIQLATNGHGGSCYEVLTVPFLTKQIRFAVADMGDRRHGYARDEDMILGMPVEKLEGIIEGLHAQQTGMNRYPIIYNLEDIPFPVPDKVLKRKFPGYGE